MFEMAKAVCSLQWSFANLKMYAAHGGSEQVKQEEERFCVTVIGSNNNCLYIYPSLTYFHIYFLRVNSSGYKARPVHIDSHDILSVGREAGHSGGVLKG